MAAPHSAVRTGRTSSPGRTRRTEESPQGRKLYTIHGVSLSKKPCGCLQMFCDYNPSTPFGFPKDC
jgi:hypothetical protein